MICNFCSTPIPEGAINCPGCGAPTPQVVNKPAPSSEPDPQGLFSELYSPDRPSLGRVEEPVIPPPENISKTPEPLPILPVAPPTPPPPGNPHRNGFAIASIILSMISCGVIVPCCSTPLPIIAVVLGVLGLPSQKKTLALSGIMIGAISLLVSIGVSIAFVASPQFSQIWQAK